jgi:hypothetical protein
VAFFIDIFLLIFFYNKFYKIQMVRSSTSFHSDILYLLLFVLKQIITIICLDSKQHIRLIIFFSFWVKDLEIFFRNFNHHSSCPMVFLLNNYYNCGIPCLSAKSVRIHELLGYSLFLKYLHHTNNQK